MKILYDGYIYSAQIVGGINRYYELLIKHLPDTFQPILSTTNKRNYNFPNNSNLKLINFKSKILKPLPLSLFLQRHYLSFLYRRIKPDIFHPTYYKLLSDENNLGKFGFPLVITVHDLIHEIFNPDSILIKKKENFIKKADRIICVSENTKKDLINIYSVDESKIIVIYLASELRLNKELDKERVVDEKYFLYVGRRDAKYKNLDLLYNAFKKAVERHSEIKLVLVGKKLSKKELSQLRDLGILDRIIIIEHTTDDHLIQLYNNSIALILPSSYEGFGLPALEAMKCGTVPVVSNVSSLPEVVGDAGILFNHESRDELTDIMIHLTENPGYRLPIIEKGFDRAKEFIWEKTVDSTVKVYESLV